MKPFFALILTLAAAAAGPVIKGPPSVPAPSGYFWQGTSVGNLSTSFPEPSGIARPNRFDNRAYLWMEQDSGGPNTFLAVNASTAATAGSWTLQGVTQSDFEDCASAIIGGTPYLYMADVGDNGNARATVVIYRCLEPTITGSDGTINSGDITTITCQYPGGNTPAHKDCECLMVDPLDGTLYLITKRIYPAQIYSLPHAASYAGTQTLTYVGKLAGDSSTTSLAIGTGSKSFTQATGLAYPVGMRLRAASAANSANFMEGEVTSQSGTSLTLNVTTKGGSGTLADWQIGLAISNTPSVNNGCVTGGSISPDGSKIAVCNYGHPYPGATGNGGTGLFLFTRSVGIETAGAALLRAPRMITADIGGGLNYPHSNPPSFPQREAVEWSYDGTALFSVGEYYSTYGTTTNPVVRYAPLNKTPTTLALQNGLNGYSGAADTYLQSEAPTADNSTATSLIADIDYSATTTNTISSVATAGGGTQITVTCSAVTGLTAGKNVWISGCNNDAYNGTWLVASVSSPNVTLNCAYAGAASSGSIIGHTGANGDRQVLLKFSDLSGVPSGVTIIGAKLVFYDNTEGKGWVLNRMIASWSETSTWNSLTSGVSFDNSECALTPDATIFPTAMDAYTGFVTMNIPVATVQGWVDGSLANQGWCITGYEESTGDGFQLDSSESATQARKPMLIIRYVTP